MAKKPQSTATAPKSPTNSTSGSPTRSKGPKPDRPLPTERIAFPKQLDILRAFAITSGEENKAVRNADVASVSDFAASTLSQANAFYCDNLLLERTPNGFIPNEAVLAFAHAHKWNPEKAAQKLAPVLTETWFAEVLLPRLQFRDIPVTEAIAALSEEVGVGPEYKDNLALILDYLEAADLIEVSDGKVSAVHQDNQPEAPQTVAAPSPAKATSPKPSPTELGQHSPPPGPSVGGNAFDFSVSFNVSMDELHQWHADRITAFFNGVAQVVAAKKGLTEEEDRVENTSIN